jgi:hypothetical protein
MNPSPDPAYPNPDVSLKKLREIFGAAAEKSTGPGKPYFQRLSRAFNAYQEKADTGNVPEFLRAEQAFSTAFADVQRFAKTDPDTAKILLETSLAIKQAAEEENIPVPAPRTRKPGKRWKI